LREALR